MEVELEVLEDFDRARKLLKQNKPEVDREEVFKVAIECLLDKKDPVRKAERAMVRAEKKIEKITAPVQNQKPRSRYIPAKKRHELHGANVNRCQYVGHNGEQCKESRALQIDHINMFCKGGGHDSENLRLLCGSHNRYESELKLGWRFNQ